MPVLLVAVAGPILSGGMFGFLLASGTEIPVAMIGLAGTCLSSGAAVFVALENRRRLDRVERKVSSPREISSRAGDDAVIVQPPRISPEDDDE